MPRWYTFEPGHPHERLRRDAALRGISQWWIDFAMQREVILNHLQHTAELDLAAWMQAHLQAIDPGLLWEFGPGIPRGRRLVISADCDPHLRPLVERILAAAPTMAGWQFLGWRVPEDLPLTLLSVEGRTGDPWLATGFRLSRLDCNRIGITTTVPAGCLRTEAQRELALQQAWIGVENLLGEQLLVTWGGGIDVAEDDPGDTSLELLSAAFLSMRQEISDALPLTLHVDRVPTAAWTSLEFTPEVAQDYPQRCDLVAAGTMNPELYLAAHSDMLFASCRFSHTEIFCYLKIDREGILSGPVVDDRSALEQALDATLHPLGLGGSFGGGTGLRYSYIDLALTDWRAAVPCIRGVLAAQRMPRRTWLLFFDSEWAEEWVGAYPDTPPPPTHQRSS